MRTNNPVGIAQHLPGPSAPFLLPSRKDIHVLFAGTQEIQEVDS
jgi:hypothetical protein